MYGIDIGDFSVHALAVYVQYATIILNTGRNSAMINYYIKYYYKDHLKFQIPIYLITNQKLILSNNFINIKPI